MSSPLVAALAARDSAAIERLLAENVVFNSPVTTYEGRADVAHLFGVIAQVIETVQAGPRIESPGMTATVLSGTVRGKAVDGVLLESLDDDGLVAEMTLLLRPLAALLAGVERMGELLAASPLPSGSV